MHAARFSLHAILAALLLASAAAGTALAHERILGNDLTQRVFYAQCQGSVNSSHMFTGVRLQIIVAHTPSGSHNPLQVTINSMPALAMRNSIYWNSDETSMSILGDTLHCKLTSSGTGMSSLHFYYMSPALYKSNSTTTSRELERGNAINNHAKPIKVRALDAELTISFQSNSVSGSIRMTGQDELAHQPAHYTATFQGQEYFYARPAP
jgi:hypothetical protein